MTELDAAGIARIHEPVMLAETIALLAPVLDAEGSVYVDATTGMGGHAAAILDACPRSRLVGIDRDTEAIELARRRLARFGERVTIVKAVYDSIADVVADNGGAADAILFDLGVSSLQIDERERGFAYSVDAPLDMRMDRTSGITAAQVVNTYDEQRLVSIFRHYGEEPFAPRIAAAIVERRADTPFSTTGELAEIAARAVPRAVQAKRGHPAKRIFQAIRIEINEELDALERAIPAAIDALRPGGRIVVLSYHSLEDRIVKRSLAAAAASTSPAGLPVELPGHGPRIRLLTRGAVKAGEHERALNPRSASVRLRAAEKIDQEAA